MKKRLFLLFFALNFFCSQVKPFWWLFSKTKPKEEWTLREHVVDFIKRHEKYLDSELNLQRSHDSVNRWRAATCCVARGLCHKKKNKMFLGMFNSRVEQFIVERAREKFADVVTFKGNPQFTLFLSMDKPEESYRHLLPEYLYAKTGEYSTSNWDYLYRKGWSFVRKICRIFYFELMKKEIELEGFDFDTTVNGIVEKYNDSRDINGMHSMCLYYIEHPEKWRKMNPVDLYRFFAFRQGSCDNPGSGFFKTSLLSSQVILLSKLICLIDFAIRSNLCEQKPIPRSYLLSSDFNPLYCRTYMKRQWYVKAVFEEVSFILKAVKFAKKR